MGPDKRVLRQMAALAVITAGLAVLIWLPEHLERRTLRQEIQEAEYALGLSTETSAGLGAWYQQVVQLREEISGAQQYVPEEDELADVLRGITEATRQEGVGDSELVTRPVTDYVNYSVIPAGVQTTATFPALFEVLRRIEKLPRLIRIDRLEIELEQPDSSELNVTLDVSTFFSKAGEREERRR